MRTWQTDTLGALIHAAAATDQAPAAQIAKLQRALRPDLALIAGQYQPAKDGDDEARYRVIDAAGRIRATITDLLGPAWTPPANTIGDKLTRIGLPVTT